MLKVQFPNKSKFLNTNYIKTEKNYKKYFNQKKTIE